jgi:hypothetical protein
MCYKIITLVNKLTQRSSDFFLFSSYFCSLDSSVSPLSGGTLLPFPDGSKKTPSPAYAAGGHCMFKIPITFFPVRSRR